MEAGQLRLPPPAPPAPPPIDECAYELAPGSDCLCKTQPTNTRRVRGLRDLLFLMSFDPCFPLPNAAASLFPSIASGAHADAKVCRFRYASPVPLPSCTEVFLLMHSHMQERPLPCSPRSACLRAARTLRFRWTRRCCVCWP